MVSAVSPFQTGLNTKTGLQIFTLKFSAFEIDTSYTSHLHVTNITSGKELENTEFNCSLHLYNKSGSHIFIGDYEDNAEVNDEEILILGGNFSEEGEYGFRITCISGDVGGDVSGVILVTGNGKPYPEGIVILGFVLMMMIIFMGITFFLVRAVGLIIDGSFDILDLAYAWGLYFGLLGLNQLTIIYLGSIEIMNWLSLFVIILAFPLVVVPVIAFFLSLFRENKTKKAEASAW